MGAAILASRSALDVPAEGLADQLHAVADAEHGNAKLENGWIATRRTRLINARGTAGEDDALGSEFLDPGGRHVVPHDLAVHALLADPPGDQLGVLRAKV